MKRDEQLFYAQQIPVLTQADWKHTGYTAYGDVAWWLKLSRIEIDDIDGYLRIGIQLFPTRYALFVGVDIDGYPERLTQDIAANPATVTIEELRAEATAIASELIRRNAASIKAYWNKI